jgi:hypothetical protein
MAGRPGSGSVCGFCLTDWVASAKISGLAQCLGDFSEMAFEQRAIESAAMPVNEPLGVVEILAAIGDEFQEKKMAERNDAKRLACQRAFPAF